MHDIKDLIIREYRWQKIQQHKTLWILFVLSIVFSLSCPFLRIVYVNSDTLPKLSAVIEGVGNISYGYLSGFLVYMFTSFFPSTKGEVEVYNRISSHLMRVFMVINNVSYQTGFEVKGENEHFTEETCRFLVEGSEKEENSFKKESGKKSVRINVENYNYMHMRLTEASLMIKQLLKSYFRELKSKEIDELNKMASMSTMLEGVRSKSPNKMVDERKLQDFAATLEYSLSSFYKIYHDYRRYEYKVYDKAYYIRTYIKPKKRK